jgi:plasmid maintenance system antidote protein VapI
MNIGKSIKVACAMNDLNQQELSENSGISTVTISHLVTGKNECTQNTLKTLAKTFEMPVSEFVALGE